MDDEDHHRLYSNKQDSMGKDQYQSVIRINLAYLNLYLIHLGDIFKDSFLVQSWYFQIRFNNIAKSICHTRPSCKHSLDRVGYIDIKYDPNILPISFTGLDTGYIYIAGPYKISHAAVGSSLSMPAYVFKGPVQEPTLQACLAFQQQWR